MGDPTRTPATLAGRYHFERPVGRGGMGTVWLCRDERLRRDVAVKQVGTLPGETAPDLARAMREARTSAALNHPNVVSIYDVVEEDDHIWLVMEYVTSRTLAQVIAEDGPLPPESAVVIGAQIAEALAETHAAGTIHRDVKPANILVTSDGVAKLSDFGIARAHDHDQLTRSGVVSGTPAYISPELARGEDPSSAADVWALGATLYATVEGHPPYEDQPNALALLATIASTPPPPTRNADFLTEPIARMLDPQPRSRWSMAHSAHVLQRLRERYASKPVGDPTTELLAPRADAAPAPATEPVPVPAPDDAVVTQQSRARRGRGVLVVPVLVGLLALAAVVGFLLLRDDPTRQASVRTPTGPGSSSGPAHHRATGDPSTSPSGSAPTTTATTLTAPVVAGGSAVRFVRSYYAALPSGTRAGWAVLSPAFQDRIGGYGNYQGFWSTIAKVSVGRTTSAGRNAVDVSLTYTRDDGGVESEVRRLFLGRQGSGYLITGDAIVG